MSPSITMSQALLLGAAVLSPATCQATNYKANAEAAFHQLQTWYNSGNGLYDTTGWWNSANALTTVANLGMLDSSIAGTSESTLANSYVAAQKYNTHASKMVKRQNFLVESTYEHEFSRKRASGGFLDGYYDDEGWWALAWIAAYDLTKNETYLSAAETIFDDMTGAWDASRCGGGIWWDKAHTYVNAIANELFLSTAAHLANRVPSKKSTYLNWAQKEWTWFKGTGMINSGNTINDGLKFTNAAKTTCANNGETVWSYNQGVILGGLVELSKAASDTSLISTAQTIASAAIKALSKNNVLHDPCEPNCGGDGSQFKGVFMRNLQILQQASKAVDYSAFIKSNAQSIWTNDQQSNKLSIDWAGSFVSPANASTQSSALDALVAAVSL